MIFPHPIQPSQTEIPPSWRNRSERFCGMQDYRLKSNRESGDGRPDLILIPYDERMPAVIMEFKYAGKPGEMEKLCSDALLQISEKQYAQELVEEGYEQTLTYGICFCRKTCRVEGGSVL